MDKGSCHRPADPLPLAPDSAYSAPMAHGADQRQFLRVSTEVEAEASGAGGTVAGSTRDISLKGMFLLTTEPFPEGSTCRLTLYLDGRAGDLRVVANGFVVRSLIDGMAIEFSELIGLESWSHLRSLVVFNAEEPQRAQEQFAAHLGLRTR
jgi:hypothetical protein